jgi:DNA-binding NarL/FixJ family response regulator
MPEPIIPIFAVPAASADRPLSGITILLVEDSRFASEAVRLLCLRSGGRIRRADCLRTAERHLATYRPTVAIVDLGLPDGSGLELIRRLHAAQPRLPAILAISGDDGLEEEARAAGADGFLAKPCTGLAAFQSAVLGALRLDRAPLKVASGADRVAPDILAYRDDLAGISELLSEASGPGKIAYAAQFLAGLARTADDPPLAEAAGALRSGMAGGAPTGALLARLAGMVEARLHGSAGRAFA